MNQSKFADQLAQYQEFFAIEHPFNVNLTPLTEAEKPSLSEFEANMPTPFKLASDMVSIDQAALRPLNQLDAVAGILVDYLHHQSKKIDLLLGYILKQQDVEANRVAGIKFGGGGIEFASEQAFAPGQLLELKLFFNLENVAIYCIGEVFEQQPTAQGFQHKVVFELIRDEDRELLVRTSLHQQSKQLQSLAQQRRLKKGEQN